MKAASLTRSARFLPPSDLVNEFWNTKLFPGEIAVISSWCEPGLQLGRTDWPETKRCIFHDGGIQIQITRFRSFMWNQDQVCWFLFHFSDSSHLNSAVRKHESLSPFSPSVLLFHLTPSSYYPPLPPTSPPLLSSPGQPWKELSNTINMCGLLNVTPFESEAMCVCVC